MAKGMNMEEFRNALASDAREENERLNKELEKLKTSSSKEIKELKEELDQYKDWCRVLANRCYVSTGGYICMYCAVEFCKHYQELQEDIDAAAIWMEKNKMPKNENTLQKAAEFIQNRRKDRIKEKFNKED